MTDERVGVVARAFYYEHKGERAKDWDLLPAESKGLWLDTARPVLAALGAYEREQRRVCSVEGRGVWCMDTKCPVHGDPESTEQPDEPQGQQERLGDTVHRASQEVASWSEEFQPFRPVEPQGRDGEDADIVGEIASLRAATVSLSDGLRIERERAERAEEQVRGHEAALAECVRQRDVANVKMGEAEKKVKELRQTVFIAQGEAYLGLLDGDDVPDAQTALQNVMDACLKVK